MGFINMGDENTSAPNMGKKLENGTLIMNTNTQNFKIYCTNGCAFMNDQMVNVEKATKKK
jgi:hypothetical protein